MTTVTPVCLLCVVEDLGLGMHGPVRAMSSLVSQPHETPRAQGTWQLGARAAVLPKTT